MQIDGGWVRVVGGLRCADRWWVGSMPISVFGGGADLCSDMFLSFFFSILVVDLAAIVG